MNDGSFGPVSAGSSESESSAIATASESSAETLAWLVTPPASICSYVHMIMYYS